jgi:hypothetical protein
LKALALIVEDYAQPPDIIIPATYDDRRLRDGKQV